MATVTLTNSSSTLSGKTMDVLENDQTITGQKTFDRDPAAPFVVTSGSAKVTNLDADKVDGHDLDQDVTTTSTPTFTNLTLTQNLFAGYLQLTRVNMALAFDGLAHNDLNIGNAGILRISEASGSSGIIIGGFTGGVDGRVLFVINAATTGGNIMVFTGAGTAANQIAAVSSGDGSLLNLGGMQVFVYDGVTSKWRQLAEE